MNSIDSSRRVPSYPPRSSVIAGALRPQARSSRGRLGSMAIISRSRMVLHDCRTFRVPHLTPARSLSAAVAVTVIMVKICVPVYATHVFNLDGLVFSASSCIVHCECPQRSRCFTSCTSVIASSKEGFLLRDKLAHYLYH